jgi:hypothetical protein
VWTPLVDTDELKFRVQEDHAQDISRILTSQQYVYRSKLKWYILHPEQIETPAAAPGQVLVAGKCLQCGWSALRGQRQPPGVRRNAPRLEPKFALQRSKPRQKRLWSQKKKSGGGLLDAMRKFILLACTPAKAGPSIAPEKLLRAQLLQMLYSIRSERLLMEEIDYSVLFRWFVGLAGASRQTGILTSHRHIEMYKSSRSALETRLRGDWALAEGPRLHKNW